MRILALKANTLMFQVSFCAMFGLLSGQMSTSYDHSIISLVYVLKVIHVIHLVIYITTITSSHSQSMTTVCQI